MKEIDWESIETLIEEIDQLQHKKLLKCGRSIIPHLTNDDLLQPNDFLELEHHPEFRYEEGILAGIKTIQMALRREFKSVNPEVLLPDVCVIIPGPTYEEARQQIVTSEKYADLFEFRLDLFSFTDPVQIKSLKNETDRPVMFTLRSKEHGGAYANEESQRKETLRYMLKLHPDYLDLEVDTDAQFFAEVTKKTPDIKIVCSWHDYSGTPNDLNVVYRKMKKLRAHFYKIVTMAHSSLDALRMLSFVRKQSQDGDKIIGICMGEDGQSTRVLSPVFGGAFTYAPVDASHATTPGQVDVETLLNTYHYKRLHPTMQLYGLLGNPVKFSKSHQTHNAVMNQLNLNAAYIKLRSAPEELENLLALAKELGFCGFSVTTPLKETVFPLVQDYSEVAFAMRALNTLKFTSEGIYGDNTDGPAVLDLIEQRMSLAGKRVVIIGAGGAAKAIAFMLHQRGAHLIILNRTLEKAKELAIQYGGKFGHLDDFSSIAKHGYDILINGTSVGLGTGEGSPIDLSALLPSKLVVEVISRPIDTELTIAAKKKKCDVIYGFEMFIDQAVKQFELWFGPKVGKDVKAVLKKQFEVTR